jgi:chromosome segregation protein
VDRKYETAIETALGGNIQNIVTEDEETAKRMIAFLKQNKGGRATFLPLTSITNPQEFKNPEALQEKGVIGMADTLVHVDKKYVNVAKAMLGRIVVVDDVDNAVKIARKFDYGIRMVTLEGELLVPGGAISGGAFKNNSNLLGRRREMEELDARVKKFLKEIDGLLQDIEDIKAERNSLRLSLEEDKAALQEKFIAQNTARLNVIKAQERKEEASEGSLELKTEEREIENQIQEIKLNKAEIQKELQESEELEKQVEAQVKEFQAQLDLKRALESEEAAHVADLDLEVEKMLQQQGFHQQNVDRINGEIERYSLELQEIEEGLLGCTEDIQNKENNILEIQQTIAKSHTSQNDTEKQLQEDIVKKEELSGRQKNFFKDRESLAERMTALDKEVYRINAQREKFREALEAQINYMWDEYEITLSDASSLRNEEMNDLPAMKREISSLKEQIKKLGDVNVNAIEDYKNLMERYTFLKNQHDDLVEAAATLEGIIEELDTAMRKQFHEKFGEISREFDKVFKEMFGGGKGTLELMEDEDILEAGIRIIAQPPGKKLQNMMQLSGGEKALTAIALLFAIQNLKPSPFCLLDEIEAALDESNVSRFAKYLHKLTKHTQFIVITHRRGTMEQVDRLYGITMQEKGVSTLVSVNLIDKELDD